MTQIVVTLENGADTDMLQRMIENMKGVLKASLREKPARKANETEEWISKMKRLSSMVDSSIADLHDERIRYLMSK